MAFVSNDTEEDDKKQGAVAPAGGGAVQLAPSAGVGSTAAGGAAAAPSKDAGGSFASLDKYITANQGQAAPLANKITGGINDQYNSLDQSNQGVLQNIQGQVSSAYTPWDKDLIAKESADPVSFANDPNNVQSFQKQLTNSYGGPNSAEGVNDYQAQQAKLNSAISQGNAQTTTESGRQQLIAKNSAAPTTGVTALNSAILSEDPTYLGKVQDAYKPFSNLVSGLGAGAAGIDKTIAANQADTAAGQKASRDAITGQMGGLNTAVQGQLATAQQNATAQNAAVKQALTTGKADPGVLSALGISEGQWNDLTAAQKAAATSEVFTSSRGQFGANSGTENIDLAQGLTQQDPNVVFNAANVATPDQYKQAGAFQSLVNGLNLDTPQLAINPANAAQAGTAPTNTTAYDYAGTLKAAQVAKQAETAAAKAYVDALQQGADEDHAQQNAKEASDQVRLAQNIGTGVGTVAGGIVGSYIPVVGTMAGAAIGGALGTAAGNTSGHVLQGYAGDVQGKPTAQRTADIVTSGAATPVIATVQTVKHIFCFHPWTQIAMADGSTKAIYEIEIGDDTKGGKVLATTRGVGTEFYWYGGVLVTGKHAVKEDGRWIRVETSPLAKKFPYLTEVVCNLVTEKHRIWAHGNEFADEHETDSYESLNLDDSLVEMNKNG